MRVAIPIAAYEVGTTGEYVARAFRRLGWEADILSQYQFYSARQKDEYDLYFCVDSGGPLNLFAPEIVGLPFNKTAFWMIDYRRGKDQKNPNDLETCKLITLGGGWVFMAQYEDLVDFVSHPESMGRCSWLPLAADTEVWSDQPKPETKLYDVGFVGNVWDGARQGMLDTIGRRYSLCWQGHGASKMEVGAALLRSSQVGFNVSSFYGTPDAFDVNMRVFETLSCGIPLVTNYVPSLDKLFDGVEFIRTYNSYDSVFDTLGQALSDESFINSGDKARQWIENYGTYTIRIKDAIEVLKNHKVGKYAA